MNDLFSNPGKLIAILCIVGLVVGFNVPIIFAFMGRKTFDAEAKVVQTALRPGEAARNQQNAQMNELHQRVEQLKKDAPGDTPRNTPEEQ